MFNFREGPQGGEFKCLWTGRSFGWVADGGQGLTKLAARRELESHQRQIRLQREQAAGRPLSTSEMNAGITHPETRTVKDQIKVTVATPPPQTNWALERASQLRADTMGTADEIASRRKLAKRMDAIAKTYIVNEKGATETLVSQEKLAGDDKYQAAMAHSATIIEAAKYSPISQGEYEGCLARQEALRVTGDAKQYWAEWWPVQTAREAKMIEERTACEQRATLLSGRITQLVASGVPLEAAQSKAVQETQP